MGIFQKFFFGDNDVLKQEAKTSDIAQKLTKNGENDAIKTHTEGRNTMTSESKALDELRSKIENILRQKNLSYEVKPKGLIFLRHGSTVLTINPSLWNNKTVVDMMAPVALKIAEVTPELLRFIAEKNFEILFGKFALDVSGNTVWLRHTLLGDNLDAEEFMFIATLIILTADQNDEKVSQMCGGKRMVDM